MRTRTGLLILATVGSLALAAPARRANPNLPWPVEPWNIPADLVPVPRAALERLEVNGIPVHVRVEPRSPRLDATLLVRATALTPGERLALSYLLQHGGLESPGGEAMATALARLGLELSVQVDADLLRLRLAGPATLTSSEQGPPAVLELLTKLARGPVLSERLLTASRDSILSLLTERRRDPILLGQDELRLMVFQTHPYSMQLGAEAVEGLTAESLKDALARLLTPDKCALAIVGPLDGPAIKSALEPLLTGWEVGQKPDRPAIPRPFESTQAKVIGTPSTETAVVAGRSLIPSNLLERTAARILAAALDAALQRTFPPGSVGRVGARLEEYADAAFLQVWAEGASPTTLDAVLRQEMARAGQGELGAREIEYARARAMSTLLASLSSLSGVVDGTAGLELLRGPQPADAGLPAEIELMRTLPASAVTDMGRALLGRGAVALVTATPGGASGLPQSVPAAPHSAAPDPAAPATGETGGAPPPPESAPAQPAPAEVPPQAPAESGGSGH